MFLEKLAVSLDVYNVSLLAYVCMTNHFHLFLTTPDGNPAEFMRHFNISYTSAFDRRHKRCGHLYQGRYKSFLIDADNYLKEVSRYIHLNPVRIKKYSDKTVKEKIHILSEYQYSSFAGYINLKARVDFVNYAKVLDNFDGDTIEGRRRYRQFVYKGLEKDAENPLEMEKNSGIVGLSGFKAYIREKYLDGASRESQREQPQLKAVKENYTPKVLIKHFCKIIDVDEKEVCRRGNNSTDRAILMELLYRFCNITQAEIGQMVGKIDYSSVSVARKRLRIKMEEDLSLKEHFQNISSKLTRIKAH